MDPIEEHPIRRYESGRASAARDKVVAETRIELEVNGGQARAALLCLPRDLEALAVGLLVGEGALRRREDLKSVTADPAGRKVTVLGDLDADALDAMNRRWRWAAGCGGGGTGRDLDAPPFTPVGAGPEIAPERLIELARQFQGAGALWRQTGGVHACALAGPESVLFLAEDVGRHNAFDKVIGLAALDGVERSDKLVITTGRLSAEIVSKAVACGVGLLASRSAVTGLAVELAKRFGLTLVGFLRGKRMNVYTGYHRVIEDGQ